MGYYYTSEHENAVPGNSWASPKTHTPGSPVKERGYHQTTSDDARIQRSATKYTRAYPKPHGGPIFNWVLSTKYTDSETGLLYYGYRFLQPETGRWLIRDLIDEAGGVNLYVFAKNDPVRRIDPFGNVCNVTYQCNLVSSAMRGKCDRDCTYLCTQTGWFNGGLGVDCDIIFGGDPDNTVVTDAQSTSSFLCRATGGLCGTVPDCPASYPITKKYFGGDIPGRDCSKKACRDGCQNTFNAVKKLCGGAGPLKMACIASAVGAYRTCVDVCNAWCNKP